MTDTPTSPLSDRTAPVPRNAGSYIGRLVGRIAKARGFPNATLVTHWTAIVGPDLAAYTRPEKLAWPQRRDENPAEKAVPDWRNSGRGATLTLRVSGPRAIEVQHMAPQVLERINGYFGYRAVTDLRFVQAPLARTGATRTRPLASAPAEDDDAPRRRAAAAALDDPGLRAAFIRLAGAIGATRSK